MSMRRERNAPPHIHVERRGDQTVVVKRAPTDPGRLDHEARMLELARHPGVAELVEIDHTSGEPVLTIVWAGDRTLDDLGALPLPEIAGITAAIAGILADVHGLGLTHGRVCAEHIVVDDRGRPVLCGWAEAARSGDSTRGSRDERRPSSDVADLGALLLGLLGPDEPSPRRAPGRSTRSASRRALTRLAHQAMAADAAARPSARAFATAIREAVPDATLPVSDARSRPGPTPEPTPSVLIDADPARDTTADAFERLRASATVVPTRRRPTALTLLVALTVSVVLALGTFAALRAATRPQSPSPLPPAASATTVTTPSAATTPTTAATRDQTTPVLEHAGHRYEIGSPGDQLIVESPACAHGPAAVIWRPSTGQLFLFDQWAGPGPGLVVGPAAHVPVGVDPQVTIVAGSDGLTCQALHVAGPDGTSFDLALGDIPTPQEVLP